jgi:hypothetical protein
VALMGFFCKGRMEIGNCCVLEERWRWWNGREGNGGSGERERGQCMARERSLVSSNGVAASLFLFFKRRAGATASLLKK